MNNIIFQLALTVLPWVLSDRHASGAVVGLWGKAVCGADDGDGFHRHPSALPVRLTISSYDRVVEREHRLTCGVAVSKNLRHGHRCLQYQMRGDTQPFFQAYASFIKFARVQIRGKMQFWRVLERSVYFAATNRFPCRQIEFSCPRCFSFVVSA